MAAKTKRAMVSLPEELESEILSVKKTSFHNETKAEMYRQLIRLGLDTVRGDPAQDIPDEERM